MLVQAKKQHGKPDDHPCGQIFQRMIFPGDVFEIPDDLVPEDPTPEDMKKDPTLAKQIVLTVGARNGNGPLREYSEKERRQAILAKNGIKGISNKDKELYLKFLHYSPQWMKPAAKADAPSIVKEQTEPATDVPNMADADAISLINRCKDEGTLKDWLEKEKAGKNRTKVVAVLNAQLRTAANQ